MTPNFWHKTSRKIVAKRRTIVLVVIGSFGLLRLLNLLRYQFGFDNQAIMFLGILCGYTFFICTSLFIPWSWFRKISYINPKDHATKKAGSYIGSALDWFFSVTLGLWYLFILVMFVVTIITKVVS